MCSNHHQKYQLWQPPGQRTAGSDKHLLHLLQKDLALVTAELKQDQQRPVAPAAPPAAKL